VRSGRCAAAIPQKKHFPALPLGTQQDLGNTLEFLYGKLLKTLPEPFPIALDELSKHDQLPT
jgi:hypothetical protein